MTFDGNFLNYFFNASVVVKCVMLILLTASVFSWTYILQRVFYLKEVNIAADRFEHAFWSGEDLNKLYQGSGRHDRRLGGAEAIFHAGFKEFSRFHKQSPAATDAVMDNTQRAMRVAQLREQSKLEKNLQFLAIVGSTSPFVGIFGTVWGIMQAFSALANVQQATISMVAPGIAEALIATALGLFAAIPAVVAYNRFVTDINRLLIRFDAFQEEFVNILVRQLQLPSKTEVVE
ncbi:MAG TPA: protein TolQ [Gammaproteobacteria bacterium]|jgi:biopolymer transport protein TolQ|nr:protein TolQ [Gammaproteobacteria bacterium]